MKFILGKKIGMTQVFTDKGMVVPVTLIEVGPCKVTQVKTKEKEGYNSIQIGFGNTKNITKSVKGQLSKNNIKENYRYMRELRVRDEKLTFKVGDELKADVFSIGDKIEVVGTSKGKGFQGVVKRHNFKGMPTTHGHRHEERIGGSTGQRFPQHTLKGLKMAGRMGNERVTEVKKEVVRIDLDKNIIAVKGGVPGRFGSLVMIKEAK